MGTTDSYERQALTRILGSNGAEIIRSDSSLDLQRVPTVLLISRSGNVVYQARTRLFGKAAYSSSMSSFPTSILPSPPSVCDYVSPSPHFKAHDRRQIRSTSFPPKCLSLRNRLSEHLKRGGRLEACHYHQTDSVGYSRFAR